MKHFIRAISTSLALLTTISTCVISVNAKTNPFNLTRGTGCIEDTDTPSLDSNSGLSSSSHNLPKVVDLSTDESFPKVGDQGQYGSCTAWATTYYQFGYEVAAMNGWNAKNDTTKQFSPKWTYNIINNGVDEGSSYDSAYFLLSKQGAVRFSEFTPSNNVNKTDTSEFTEWYLDTNGMKNALKYRISDYYHRSFANTRTAETPIVSPNSACLTTMKSLLNSGKILTISTDFGEWDYQNLTSQYKSSLNGQYVCIKQYDPDGKRSGHAMAIVGYDDNISYDLNGDGVIQTYEKGAFKIVNSWGTNYGNDGFIWVMYDALNKVSNTDKQNVSTRKPIFDSYGYYYINVEEYSLDLIAEVSLSQTTRNEVKLKLGQSDYSSTAPSNYAYTMLQYNGGDNFNFSGLSNSKSSATFVFDYGTLLKAEMSRQNFYVTITDKDTGNPTTINSIKLIVKRGKNVVNDTINKVIDRYAILYKYSLGKVGDINNDNIIDTRDITDLQNYLSGTLDLSANDKLVADVNGDGEISVNDVLALQYYVAGINDNFANGIFVELS